jgi:uncharacterized protein YndB with AHSA1/START domain
MANSIVFAIDYDLAPEKIWRTLTDSELLARWLMPNTFRPELGAEFEFRAKPIGGWDGIARCKVLEIDPPRRLIYSWRTGVKAAPGCGCKCRSTWRRSSASADAYP